MNKPIDHYIDSIRVNMPTYIGYHGYELTVNFRIDSKEYKKLKGLGNIVLDLNNWLYKQLNFPAYNPSVNTKIRASKGIKILTFSYMFESKELAKQLGYCSKNTYLGVNVKFNRSKPVLSLIYSNSSKVA